jgi:hypothetical protein
MKTMLRPLVLALVVGLSGAAIADGSWSEKVNYRRSDQTSIKITEPEGFKIAVVLADGTERTGTVPELFNLADQDAFVHVTLMPTDGSAPWKKRVEVRARQQTELAVTFKPDAKGEPAKRGAKYVGRMANHSGGCAKAWDRTIRVEFLQGADRAVVKQVQIDASKNVDVELPGGATDVRVYIWNDKEWKFVVTSGHEIAKDGWSLGFGCPKGTKTPAVVTM